MLILDHLLTGLHDACAAFPDKRKGPGDYSMADIGLSAFSLFLAQFALAMHGVATLSIPAAAAMTARGDGERGSTLR